MARELFFFGQNHGLPALSLSVKRFPLSWGSPAAGSAALLPAEGVEWQDIFSHVSRFGQSDLRTYDCCEFPQKCFHATASAGDRLASFFSSHFIPFLPPF